MARRVILTHAAEAAAARTTAGYGSSIQAPALVRRHGPRQRFGGATRTRGILSSSTSSAVSRAKVFLPQNVRCLWVPSTSTVDWGGGDVTTSNMSSANWVRHQSSSGSVDYSTLMAGPGTPLHNDIMLSASRNQTGYVHAAAVHTVTNYWAVYCPSQGWGYIQSYSTLHLRALAYALI